MLYAALAEDDAVGVIDTTTLTQTAEYSLGTAVATPYSLAIQSGKLWVSYNGTPAGFAGEGAIGLGPASPARPAAPRDRSCAPASSSRTAGLTAAEIRPPLPPA